MSTQSSKNPLLRISKTGEMRLRNKVGHAILTENAYEDRALNAKLQTLTSHRNRHEHYMTSRQLEFATKRITASEERPRTIATGENSRERLSSLALPPIESPSGNRRAFSESRCTAPDLTHVKPRTTQAKWEKAITLVRLAVQSRQSRDTDSQAFITQQTGQKDLQGPLGLPPLTPSFKPRSQRRKRRSKRLTLPEMLRVSREMSRTGIEDSRFQNLEDCLSGGLKLSGSGQSEEGTDKNVNTSNNVHFAKQSGVRTL